jgi:outer membrane protein assembly factor BamA
VNVNYSNIRLFFNANRKLSNNFFAGIGLDYDNYSNISSTTSLNNTNVFEKYGIGTGSHSSAFGINFNILHDNRKNQINPANGWYSALIYRVNPLSSNDGQWTSIYLDVRKYFRLNSTTRKIIALSGFYWGSDGMVPYLNLPGTQLEFTGRSGRGYAWGRFRGKQMLYLESEYRFDISRNGLLGAVLFANAQSLSDDVSNEFTAINPAIGFGARMKFNKESDTNLTLDFGFGKDSFGFYIGLGEFF